MPSCSRPPRSVSLISFQWFSISQVKVRANSKLEIVRCASFSRSKPVGQRDFADIAAPARASRSAASSTSVRVVGSNWSQTWVRHSAMRGGRSSGTIGCGGMPSSTSR